MELTELENAMLSAHELAAGLAALALVKDLIERGDEAKLACSDLDLPREVRVEALRDGREANQALALVAAAQEVAGISA